MIDVCGRTKKTVICRERLRFSLRGMALRMGSRRGGEMHNLRLESKRAGHVERRVGGSEKILLVGRWDQ